MHKSESSWNPNSNKLQPDSQHHDRLAARVIAQQYSSSTVVWLRQQENIRSAFQKYYFYFSLFKKKCLSLKMRDLKLRLGMAVYSTERYDDWWIGLHRNRSWLSGGIMTELSWRDTGKWPKPSMRIADVSVEFASGTLRLGVNTLTAI
jgi:hypothetical protein